MKRKPRKYAYYVSHTEDKGLALFFSFREALDYAMTHGRSVITREGVGCDCGCEPQTWTLIQDKNNSLELPF